MSPLLFCLKRTVSIIFIMLFLMTTAQAASFNCRKAESEIEKLICSEAALSKLDESMSKAYLQALKRTDIKEQTIKSQKQWLKNVRNACQSAECVRTAYKSRIKVLSLRSPSGKKALSANRESLTIVNRDNTETRVTALDVTSDGTRIITGDENGSIKIWKKDDLSMLLAIPGHRYRTQQVILSPDDRYIVSYSAFDEDVNVWELPSGRLAHTYRVGGGIGRNILFNKKGTVLIFAHSSQEIIAVPFKIGERYSVTTNDDAIWSMKVDEDAKHLRVIALSPDKKLLATALNGYEDSIFFYCSLVEMLSGNMGQKRRDGENNNYKTSNEAKRPH